MSEGDKPIGENFWKGSPTLYSSWSSLQYFSEFRCHSQEVSVCVLSESPIHQNFKSCHQKAQLDFLMTESPILLLNKKIALRYEFEVLTSEIQILMDWTF